LGDANPSRHGAGESDTTYNLRSHSMKLQASVAAGNFSIIRRVLGRKSMFMVPSATVVGRQRATPDRKKLCGMEGADNGFMRQRHHPHSPYLDNSTFGKIMLRSPFLAERGLV
jgi:hypothetical protein